MSIDISKPHIGRVYDYVLGGSYNYEADRRAAEAILELVPAYPQWARLNRSFLGHVGRRWKDEGRKLVLDLGSGLPTQGHFNEHLPDARILFADSDDLSVVQGQQLLAYTPEMAYVKVDIREADALVAQAEGFFGKAPRLAVGCIGIVYFLSDDEVRRLMHRLHDYCAPGSVMALSFHDVPPGPEGDAMNQILIDSAKHARIAFYPRTPEHLGDLLSPWRGFTVVPLADVLPGVAPPPVQPDHPIHRARMLGAFAEY
jgi:hypothetical protein